ncbi:RNA polymerase sigma factor [Lysinibacillus xylanilyticus]|uniref:RNA polymerase sigma factor n=1 Tax=Lysinibacillus xylanilyticus TaxID=582475 RepID=UPI003D043AB1
MINQNPFEVIEEIYEEHYTYLRNFLIGLTKSYDVADDIIQELFAKILTDPSRVQQVTYMKSWLVKAANSLIMALNGCLFPLEPSYYFTSYFLLFTFTTGNCLLMQPLNISKALLSCSISQ